MLRNSDRQAAHIDISRCFKDFTAAEQLESVDSWYCPKCKKPVAAIKKFELWNVPDVLVLNFKRFKFATTGQGSER